MIPEHFEDPVNRTYVIIQSYLDGKANCTEVIDVMKELDLPAAKLAGIMRQLSDYGDRDKYSLLRQECGLFGLY